jgi:hypothetical protein
VTKPKAKKRPRLKAVHGQARCQTCRHWAPLDNTRELATFGECHRHAPGPGDPRGGEAVWPQTDKDDWCGEYDRRA